MLAANTEQNGLLSEQIEPTKRLLDREAEAALRDAAIAAKPTVATVQEQHEKAAAQERLGKNIFKQQLAEILSTASTIQNPEEANLYIKGELEKKKKETLEIMIKGPEKKGFLQIFGEGLSGVNPIALIGGGVASAASGGSFMGSIFDSLKKTAISSIKDAAISFGGDATAGWMKAFKDNFATWMETKSWGTKNSDQATAEMKLGLAAQALAAASGIDLKANPGFLASIVTGVAEEKNKLAAGNTNPMPAPDAKDSEKTAEKKEAAGNEGVSLKTGRVDVGANYPVEHVDTGTPVVSNISVNGLPSVRSIT
jgi:hypothetical protein